MAPGTVTSSIRARRMRTAQAFRALRSLGFRESETRAALERVRTGHAASARLDKSVETAENLGLEASPQSIIRAALSVLASSRQVRISEHLREAQA